MSRSSARYLDLCELHDAGKCAADCPVCGDERFHGPTMPAQPMLDDHDLSEFVRPADLRDLRSDGRSEYEKRD